MKKPPFFSGSHGRGLFIAATLLLTVSLGWWMGLRGRQTHTSSQPGPVLTPSSVQPAALPTPTADEEARAQSWLEEINREPTPMAQAAAAARLADRLPAEDWPILLSHLNKFPLSLVRPILEAAIERRWAEADPAGAASWGLKNHASLAAAAVAVWVRQDKAAAMAWFEALTPAQRESGQIAGEFYSALLITDYPAALESIMTHQNDARFEIAFGWAGQDLVNAVTDKALKFAEQLTNPKLKQSIRDKVALVYAKADPLKAVAWARAQPDAETMVLQIFKHSDGSSPIGMFPALASLPPEEQKYVLSKTWVWWERGDPFANFEALRHPPAGLTEESRKYLLTRTREVLMNKWDPPEIARLMQHGWEDMAGVWEVPLAENWSAQDPDAALAWIGQLPEGPMKEKALLANTKVRDEARAKLQPRDPVATAAGNLGRINNISLPGLSSFSGTEGIIARLDDEERRRLPDEIASLPEDQRPQARTRFITFLASNYPAQAAAWLKDQTASPDFTEQSSRLAANWALDDAPAAANWAASLPAGEAKSWVLWNLARQWHRVSAGAAQHWAEQQPGADRALLESAFAGRRPQ